MVRDQPESDVTKLQVEVRDSRMHSLFFIGEAVVVGRFILGILVGIVLVIILFVQCTRAIF